MVEPGSAIAAPRVRAQPRRIAFNFSANLSAACGSRAKKNRGTMPLAGTYAEHERVVARNDPRPRFPDARRVATRIRIRENATATSGNGGAARPPVAAPRGFFLDPRARFYSAHGKQFCPIINRAIVGGWLYARGAFHTSECNGNQIERRRARGPSAGVNTR